MRIIKKQAEELLRQNIYKNNIKPVLINTAEKKYLRGLELVVDQYVCDEIRCGCSRWLLDCRLRFWRVRCDYSYRADTYNIF